jgi:nitroimidazol reductase NimA-like FMN-containing flavoprotein (pyridoxamine 5'-phosphate oxidase superfamily)
MNEQTITRAWIERALSASRLAVLATEGEAQPHASLVAITPVGLLRELVFATYRNTRKYGNLVGNGRVAVLMHGADTQGQDPQGGIVLTATGLALEARGAHHERLAAAHLHRHPDLAGFLGSADCAVFCVAVESYQVVRGIDDAGSWSLGQLGVV